MQNPILTPKDFFDQVVIPDCQEALEAPGDVRKMLHACMSLQHLREWIFYAGMTDYQTAGDYYTVLNERCPELKEIRAVAINSKHPSPTKAPIRTIGASARNTVGWGTSWGNSWKGWASKEETHAIAKADDGKGYWISDPLSKAFNFWKAEFENNSW